MVFHRQSNAKCIGEHFFPAPQAECTRIRADRSLSLSLRVSLGTLFTDPPLAWVWDQDVGEASSAKPCLGVLGTASPFAPLSQSLGSWWHLHLP